MAFAHLALGDTVAGRAACEAAIRIIDPLCDAWALLHAEGLLGGIARAEHRFDDAARHHAHAAGSAAAVGFDGAAALHTANLGRAQHSAGDPAAAAATLRRAIAGAEQQGDLSTSSPAERRVGRSGSAVDGTGTGGKACLRDGATMDGRTRAGRASSCSDDPVRTDRHPVIGGPCPTTSRTPRCGPPASWWRSTWR